MSDRWRANSVRGPWPGPRAVRRREANAATRLGREADRFKVQVDWLKEQGADLRARTQAEYLYTAAALALSGGVIAAQQNGWPRVLVAIVALLIVWKIIADHETYRRIWKSRREIIERLEPLEPPPKYFIFPRLEGPPREWPWVKWGKGLITCSANLPDPIGKLVGKVGGFLAPHTPVGLRGTAGRGYRISILIVLGAVVAVLFCPSRLEGGNGGVGHTHHQGSQEQ
jgi:hypothetical protein